jgi:predicted dehydrogenase
MVGLTCGGAIIDLGCHCIEIIRSFVGKRNRPVELFEWRGGTTARIGGQPEMHDGKVVIKRELLPDGRQKLIRKDTETGDFADVVIADG